MFKRFLGWTPIPIVHTTRINTFLYNWWLNLFFYIKFIINSSPRSNWDIRRSFCDPYATILVSIEYCTHVEECKFLNHIFIILAILSAERTLLSCKALLKSWLEIVYLNFWIGLLIDLLIDICSFCVTHILTWPLINWLLFYPTSDWKIKLASSRFNSSFQEFSYQNQRIFKLSGKQTL